MRRASAAAVPSSLPLSFPRYAARGTGRRDARGGPHSVHATWHQPPLPKTAAPHSARCRLPASACRSDASERPASPGATLSPISQRVCPRTQAGATLAFTPSSRSAARASPQRRGQQAGDCSPRGQGRTRGRCPVRARAFCVSCHGPLPAPAVSRLSVATRCAAQHVEPLQRRGRAVLAPGQGISAPADARHRAVCPRRQGATPTSPCRALRGCVGLRSQGPGPSHP